MSIIPSDALLAPFQRSHKTVSPTETLKVISLAFSPSIEICENALVPPSLRGMLPNGRGCLVAFWMCFLYRIPITHFKTYTFLGFHLYLSLYHKAQYLF
jgi:hypothetical protein